MENMSSGDNNEVTIRLYIDTKQLEKKYDNKKSKTPKEVRARNCGKEMSREGDELTE